MSLTRELPRYQCHKQVQALKINHVVPSVRGYMLGFEDQGYAPIEIGFDFMAKHQPKPGDYFVVYADGYQSCSPAEAFEEGYTLIET